MFADIAAAGLIRVLSLRYFNPIGADPKMRTGLQLRQPTHALGKMLQAYEEGVPFLITGTDWPTRDGSGIRDYVHVWDLAAAHRDAQRRPGDTVGAYTRIDRAERLLDWRPRYDVTDGIRHSLQWAAIRDQILPEM
jgi:UDP-glucose 4-epimerase